MDLETVNMIDFKESKLTKLKSRKSINKSSFNSTF
jgi:hypothetical protein